MIPTAGKPPILVERLYLWEILKGLSLTINHMFKSLLGRYVTMQYPEEKWEPPEYYRGLHHLVVGPDGTELCVACGMCALACPSDAITIEAGEAPEELGEKYPACYHLNLARCIFCGFCVEACPKGALVMTGRYELAVYNRRDLLYDKPHLKRTARPAHQR